MNEPTVYIVIDESAIARDESGEIVETVEWHDGKPDWTHAGICDHRGGGGAWGYGELLKAVNAAELNARLCGFSLQRVPVEPPRAGA